MVKKKKKVEGENSEEKVNILDELSYRHLTLAYQKASAEALQRMAEAAEKRNQILENEDSAEDEEEDEEEE